ncbi:MAG: YraN family protein [Pseudomonadota bacterium]
MSAPLDHRQFSFDLRPPAAEPAMRRGTRAHLTGHAAEDTAARLYADRGYEVLARRHRNAAGEIDLIVRQGTSYAFVEVKCRRTHDEAVHAITARQLNRLEAAANIYILDAQLGTACDFRFDVVCIDRSCTAHIIENAHVF